MLHRTIANSPCPDALALWAILCCCPLAAQATLTVPSPGLPNLAVALQAAQANDVIRYSGDSWTQPVVIDKPVTIVGVGRPDVRVVAIVESVTFRNVRVVPLRIDFNNKWHCTIQTSGTLRFEDCLIEPSYGSLLDERMPTRALLSGLAGSAEFVRSQVLIPDPVGPGQPHFYCGTPGFEWLALSAVSLGAPLFFEDCLVRAGNAQAFTYDPSTMGPGCFAYPSRPGSAAVIAPRTIAVRTRFEDGNSSNQPHPTAQAAGALLASQFGVLQAYEAEWQPGVVGGASGPRGAVQTFGSGTAPLSASGPAILGRPVSLTMAMQPGEVGFLLMGLPLAPSRATSFGDLHADFVAAVPMTDRVPLAITVPGLPALAGLTVHGQALITRPGFQLQNPVSLRCYR